MSVVCAEYRMHGDGDRMCMMMKHAALLLASVPVLFYIYHDLQMSHQTLTFTQQSESETLEITGNNCVCFKDEVFSYFL